VEYFLERMERRVVFPEPEGPMMARVVPGVTKPVRFWRMVFWLIEAERFYQVRVVRGDFI
jgi:hypothetical protein